MIVETVSGSQYEVDVGGRRARRLAGTHPVPRMPDGVWRTFAGMLPIQGPELGKRMFFEWADESVGAPAAAGFTPGTVTTPVYQVLMLSQGGADVVEG
jgi:hypothetical protein